MSTHVDWIVDWMNILGRDSGYQWQQQSCGCDDLTSHCQLSVSIDGGVINNNGVQMES